LSSTIVPINAKHRPANRLRFFMHPPSARFLARRHCGRIARPVSLSAERQP
jgi:hypothetical protein